MWRGGIEIGIAAKGGILSAPLADGYRDGVGQGVGGGQVGG